MQKCIGGIRPLCTALPPPIHQVILYMQMLETDAASTKHRKFSTLVLFPNPEARYCNFTIDSIDIFFIEITWLSTLKYLARLEKTNIPSENSVPPHAQKVEEK